VINLRPELTELPLRMKDLPIDERGFPTPWFVEWVNGAPDFRLMSGEKWRRAVREKLCWVCGQKLGSYLVFCIGPMCALNRTTSEPPCHRECARWSAANCPFLSRPHMVRREGGLPEEAEDTIGGIGLKRNPGVTLLWITRTFTVWKPDGGGLLIEVGEPIEVEWYAEGRPATRAEVEESVRTGLPLLEEMAKTQIGGLADLLLKVARVELLYPKA
jgi:hypothetical protein